MKTAGLAGALLDYWVAKADGMPITAGEAPQSFYIGLTPVPRYSSDWSQGGPIIEREGIATARFEYETPPERRWRALHGQDADGGGYFASVDFRHFGPTPLVAAMRAYVASKFGDDVPDA